MKTLVLSGSIRSRDVSIHYILERANELSDLNKYISDIENFMKKNEHISNSDILSGVSLLAMKMMGAEIDYFPLKRLFPRKEISVAYTADKKIDPELALTDTLSLNSEQFEKLIERISNADGVILVTPVYFGDRSSVANKLLQLSGIYNLLNNKIFGCISVGAKRNGGQETTVIYSLYEALNQNAIVVGNGPPTSQYGGTAVGGKKGTVIKDSWGLETAFGTGVAVSHVSELYKKGKNHKLERPLRITILITMDDIKGTLKNFLGKLIEKAKENLPNVIFKIEYVLNSTIYRCLACDVCPSDGPLPLGQRPTKENRPRCIIRNKEDGMEKIRDLLLDADGIIIAGLNVEEHDKLLYRYQVLTERTRYIRRDHFELTDKLITSFSLNQVGERINSLHSLKTLTSYIRHNSIIHKPIEAYVYNQKVLKDGMSDLLQFINSAQILAVGKENVKPMVTEYTTKGIGGY